jgi:hypothetical protein
MRSRLFVAVVLVALAGCNFDGSSSSTSSPQNIATPLAATVGGSSYANSGGPIISGNPATSVVAGEHYSFQPTASDSRGNGLQFTIRNKPTWAVFDSASGLLGGTPTSAQTGTYASIVISVLDGSAIAVLPPFSISVTAHGAPTIAGVPPTSVMVGSAYKFVPAASDPAGAAISFTIQNKPSWAIFSASSGELSGTPAAENVGTTNNILISVTDGTNSSSLPAFSVAVLQSTTGSATLSWVPPSQNTDGTVLMNLVGYRIYYGTSPASLTQTIDVRNAGLTTYFIGDLTPATWYFAVKSLTKGNVESALSAVVSKVITLR